jgi:hypothetical protein
MDESQRQAKVDELAQLRARVTQLESDLSREVPSESWRATDYYTAYYATAGFVLGMFAAMASLVFNVVGSFLVGQYPLELIRVYLTFPLDDRALELDTGLAMAIGCCLYLGTGMLLGIFFHLVLTRWTAGKSFGTRLAVASVLALAVWLFNYYGVLAWLQPLLIPMSSENLIVNRVPPGVAALTHLVFGWTMALLYPLGLYVPYRLQTERPRASMP